MRIHIIIYLNSNKKLELIMNTRDRDRAGI